MKHVSVFKLYSNLIFISICSSYCTAHLILYYPMFISSHITMSYPFILPISHHPILPCLIHLSHFTSSHITLSYPSISFSLIPYYLVLSIHLISPHPILPCLIHPSHFTSSHITLSYPSISFHLIPYYLVLSIHLISPHPILPRLIHPSPHSIYSYTCTTPSHFVSFHPISSHPISFDLRLFLKIGINECDSMPCQNGGKCVNLNTEDASSGVGSGMATLHKCVCAAGYTGKFCETK